MSSAFDPVFTFFTETEKKMKNVKQTKLSFETGGENVGQEVNERKRKREGDGDDRGRAAGTAHYTAHNAISSKRMK